MSVLAQCVDSPLREHVHVMRDAAAAAFDAHFERGGLVAALLLALVRHLDGIRAALAAALAHALREDADGAVALGKQNAVRVDAHVVAVAAGAACAPHLDR